MFFAVVLVVALILYALFKIIHNQETIIYQLDCLNEAIKKSRIIEKKTCQRCSKEYEAQLTSCPHCGNRD